MKKTLALTLVIALLSGLILLATPVYGASAITFAGEELLGKPTDTSITVNIVPASTIEYHYQYGTSPESYTMETPNYTAAGGQPHEIVISGLAPDTQYYYRMQYHAPGDVMSDWVNRTEYSFWTQRAEGSTFKFTIVSDSHALYGSQYHNTMANVRDDQPDFHFDLGDTFITDYDTNQGQVNAEYLAQRGGDYMDLVGHSSPIFLASGNHENEEGWNFDDAFSIALASVKARKLYYPTPVTDGFYSGNDDPLTALDPATYGDQYREDYYALDLGRCPFRCYRSLPVHNDQPVRGNCWRRV